MSNKRAAPTSPQEYGPPPARRRYNGPLEPLVRRQYSMPEIRHETQVLDDHFFSPGPFQVAHAFEDNQRNNSVHRGIPPNNSTSTYPSPWSPPAVHLAYDGSPSAPNHSHQVFQTPTAPPQTLTLPPITSLLSPLLSPSLPLLSSRVPSASHSTSKRPRSQLLAESSSPPTPCRPMSKDERFDLALQTLRDGRYCVFDLMNEVLDPQSKHHRRRVGLYQRSASKIIAMLDHIMLDPCGASILLEWFKPHAIKEVCGMVSNEMDLAQAKLSLSGGIGGISPQFIANWSHENILGITAQETPTLVSILHAGAQTKRGAEKNTKKTPNLACQVIVSQLAYLRSNRSTKFHAIFSMYLWSTGCARQTIDALFRCGLATSYDTTLNLINHIANKCVELAIDIGKGPHLLAYDNINISTSIHVEQRGSTTPGKVQSGTFPVIYSLRNAHASQMLLAPIMDRLKRATALSWEDDIRPTQEQSQFFHRQLTVIAMDILATYCQEFAGFRSHPLFQHVPRRQIPAGYKTSQFPLRVSSIEEASVVGNLAVHEDIYIHQLKRCPLELSQFAIPTINDQSTNARIRGAKILRSRDLSAWDRREVFQLGFGLFHLCLNLVWVVLHTHKGSLHQTGSLTHLFLIIEKSRLSGHHPDYYTLLSSLTQIAHGLILNAWRLTCGHSTLVKFAESNPTPEEISEHASRLVLNYATPFYTADDDNTSSSSESASIDVVQQNIRLLTRDLLYVIELIRAISDGDWGRVEDFLPQLAMMFRGAGSNNYCTEILHFLFNLKKVWTQDFANIMRDNMIINISGLPGHAMPVDLNIEHLIGYMKTLFMAKGLYSTWDRLGDVSAAVYHLQHVKKEVNIALAAAYQGTSHTTTDTSHLVWRVANKARELSLQEYDAHREPVKSTTDILWAGEKKLCSASLATFNKKVLAMAAGKGSCTDVEEEDEMPPIMINQDKTISIDCLTTATGP